MKNPGTVTPTNLDSEESSPRRKPGSTVFCFIPGCVQDRAGIKGLLPKTCISEKTSRSGRISHFVIPAGLLGRNPVFSLSSLINEQFLRRRWTRLKNPAGVTVIEISRPAKNCRLWCLWSESIRATARKPRPYSIVSQLFRREGEEGFMPSRRARFERNSVSLSAAAMHVRQKKLPGHCVKISVPGRCKLRQLNVGFQTISSSIFPAISSGLIWYVPLFNWFTIC